MSVTNDSNKITHILDGVTSVFPYDFKIFKNSEMTATVVNIATGAITATLALTTDFTVSGAGDAGGGNVTILGNLYSNAEKFVLLREVPFTQELLFRDNEATPKATWAEGYDRAVMLAQQLKEEVDRSIKVNVGASVTPVLPSPVDGNVIVWVGVDGTMENAPYDVASLNSAISETEASAAAALASKNAAETAEINAETAETNAEASELAAAASAASFDQTKIEDVDQNTVVETERTSDDNIIYMKTAGTDRVIIDADGNMTKPTQPAFSVISNANQNNIATGGVTVIFGGTEYDIGSNFSANTFTAPVTGKYQLSAIISLTNIDINANTYHFKMVTSNRTYEVIMDPGQFAADITGKWSLHISILADMDASDTVIMQLDQTSGAAQSDIATGNAKFTGFLAT